MNISTLRKAGLIYRLAVNCLNHQQRAIHHSPVVWAGAKWRLQHGMGRCGNEYGPLVDTPDWSYADGRPAPLGHCEQKRRENQKRLAERVVELIGQLKTAKQLHQSKQQQQINHEKRLLQQRLKPQASRR